MNIRAQQREETRDQIIKAAIQAFAKHGFEGASTRDVADRASVNQGLLTYHFKSKDLLWREAAKYIFTDLRKVMVKTREKYMDEPPKTQRKMRIKEYVRFCADHPELFRFIIATGQNSDERMKWLVDELLSPIFAGPDMPMFEGKQKIHAFYSLIGASNFIFAVRPLCQRLTGVNPKHKDAIEAHAEYVANLFTA